MLKFAPKSLAPKLLLVTGAIIAVLLVATNIVLISQTRDRVGSLIGQQAETEAKAIAQGIVTDTSALASAARTMSGIIAHGKQLGVVDRKAVIDILKTNLEQQKMAFGSWFAEAPQGFDTLQAQSKDKLDVGGNKVLDETLTREEALTAHTRSNAYLFFQEKTLGSLEVGKQADLVVLDRDYMTVPAAEIRRIKPTMTMVGGRVVFEGGKPGVSDLLRSK